MSSNGHQHHNGSDTTSLGIVLNGHGNGLNGHGTGEHGSNGHDSSLGVLDGSTIAPTAPRFTFPSPTSASKPGKRERREARQTLNGIERRLARMPAARRQQVKKFLLEVCDVAPDISDVAFRRATKGSLECMRSYKPIPETCAGVWILGSARFKEETAEYEAIRALTRIHTQATLGRCPVIQGGGPGAMEAGAHGGREGGAEAFGLQLTLQHEEKPNAHSSRTFRFTKFGPRKQRMLELSKMLITYPGGFGTEDELWEGLCMMQCLKSEVVPFYLVGTRFWLKPIGALIAAKLRAGTISPKDLKFITVVDLHHSAIRAEDQMQEVLQIGERLPGHETERPALRVIGVKEWLHEVATYFNVMNPSFDSDLHSDMVERAISRVADVHMPPDW